MPTKTHSTRHDEIMEEATKYAESKAPPIEGWPQELDPYRIEWLVNKVVRLSDELSQAKFDLEACDKQNGELRQENYRLSNFNNA